MKADPWRPLRDLHGLVHQAGARGSHQTSFTWCELGRTDVWRVYKSGDLIPVDADTPITCLACLGTREVF